MKKKTKEKAIEKLIEDLENILKIEFKMFHSAECLYNTRAALSKALEDWKEANKDKD